MIQLKFPKPKIALAYGQSCFHMYNQPIGSMFLYDKYSYIGYYTYVNNTPTYKIALTTRQYINYSPILHIKDQYHIFQTHFIKEQ